MENGNRGFYYILKGVEETAKQTLHLIEGIRRLMQDYKNRLRSELPKIYSQDLLNNIFKHPYPYTKIEFLENDLTVKRKTGAKYLNQLVKLGLLQKVKIGTSNFYINQPLYKFFTGGVPVVQPAERIKTVANQKNNNIALVLLYCDISKPQGASYYSNLKFRSLNSISSFLLDLLDFSQIGLKLLKKMINL